MSGIRTSATYALTAMVSEWVEIRPSFSGLSTSLLNNLLLGEEIHPGSLQLELGKGLAWALQATRERPNALSPPAEEVGRWQPCQEDPSLKW
jgi:hypothetical protein